MIWAVSLLSAELSPRVLTAYTINTVFGVWLENLEKLQGILFSALPPYCDDRRQPQSCFGKNQLLPNSISFSLLTTSHPRLLHGSLVRSSPQFSSGFNLLMASSSGFGSWTSNIIFRAINTRFRYACAPKGLRLLAIQTRWLVLQKARRHPNPCGRRAPTLCKQMVSGTISPGSTPYFSPFPHGTGSLSVILII